MIILTQSPDNTTTPHTLRLTVRYHLHLHFSILISLRAEARMVGVRALKPYWKILLYEGKV
jgi:hypothetical protein